MSRFSGGFVGVDIFYVVSGFLIGGIVAGEMEEGTFSIGHFYRRRLKRILPALVAMLLLTTLAALFILFPAELSEYASSMIATTTWAANFYFWATTDYFLVDRVTPLLHCWSLGVEEQYYLFFPLLMMLVFRLWPTFFPMVITLLAGASLVLSVALTASAPMANFYLLPTRAWELLLGVLAARIPIPQLNWRPLREALGALGLILIVAPILAYTSRTQFPGLRALPPCFGAAAIIVAGAQGRNISSILLSARPIVFIGLISYSLYLWHWPIIVFILRALPAVNLDRTTKLIALALSATLAVLSWQFIERPFRASKRPVRQVLCYSAAASIVLIFVATLLIATGGLPLRYGQRVATLSSVLGYSYDKPFRAHQCFLDLGDTIGTFDRQACLSESRTKPNVLLLGDSHAAQLWSGLHTVFRGSNVMQATAAICRPFYFRQDHIAQLENIGEFLEKCNFLMDFVYNEYLSNHRPDLVILAVRWILDDQDGLAKTLDWLTHRQFAVLVVGPDPNWYLPVPMLAALAVERNDPGLIERHFDKARGAALDERFAALAAARGVKYVSTYKALCTAAGCRTLGDSGLPLIFDYGHLTAEGSELVARQFNDPSLRP